MDDVTPMLARSGKPFSDADWIFEVKWDGTRALCRIDGRAHFFNRKNTDITYRYPELQNITNYVRASCVLDGEIVVLKKGSSSFRDLQRREHTDDLFKIKLLSEKIPAVYIVFDILSVHGEDLTKKKLLVRKEILKKTVFQSAYSLVCPYIEEKGKDYFEAAVKRGFEGVIAKRKDSLYYPGKRSDAWLKIKKTKTIDCVIGGFTTGARKKYFGALLLGVNQPLQFIGKVGTGFTDETLTCISQMLKKRETDVNPFTEKISGAIHFVEPVHVCEVKYIEFTADKKLRAPVFVRLRPDKPPEECTLNVLLE